MRGRSVLDPYDYHMGRKPDRTYVSKEFFDKKLHRRVRVVFKVFDEEQHQVDRERDVATEVDSLVLFEQQNKVQRVELQALLYADSRGIEKVNFVMFEDDSPSEKCQITLSAEALQRFSVLLNAVRGQPFEGQNRYSIEDDLLHAETMSETEVRRLLAKHPGIVQPLVQYDLTDRDIVGIGYRKKQLEIFEGMLTDVGFFEQKQHDWNKAGAEDTWQHFFEVNPWIFGYGLQYVFTSKFDQAKRTSLKQWVAGTRIGQSAKESDALMKTNGAISSVCFVEIKKPETPLIKKAGGSYRAGCWQASNELTGAIAQTQQTVRLAMKDIGEELQLSDDKGFPIESAYLYQPKSFIVIGSLKEFIRDGDVNEEQWPSFQVFRRNLINPEIITFDELLERARHIVQHSEEPEVEVDSSADEGGEVPF